MFEDVIILSLLRLYIIQNFNFCSTKTKDHQQPLGSLLSNCLLFLKYHFGW